MASTSARAGSSAARSAPSTVADLEVRPEGLDGGGRELFGDEDDRLGSQLVTIVGSGLVAPSQAVGRLRNSAQPSAVAEAALAVRRPSIGRRATARTSTGRSPIQASITEAEHQHAEAGPDVDVDAAGLLAWRSTRRTSPAPSTSTPYSVNRPPMIRRMSNRRAAEDFASSVRSISGSRPAAESSRARRQTWFVLSVTRTGCRAGRPSAERDAAEQQRVAVPRAVARPARRRSGRWRRCRTPGPAARPPVSAG